MAQERRLQAPAIAVLVGGLGLALSGCAYSSMSEFAQAPPSAAAAEPVVLTDAVPAPTPAPASAAPTTLAVAPTALAEEETPPLPRTAPVPPTDDAASVTPSPATTPDGYPNINAVPPKPNSKLLTAEEKAKVIADLEALAKAQGIETAKVRKAQAAACAAEAADPNAPVKSENPPVKC